MPSPEIIERHITRRGLVALEAVASLEKALTGNPFTRLEVARPETSEVRHWAVNLSMADAERLPIFDGALLHAGRPPNRICFAPRFSFAFKIEKAPA